MKHIIEAFGKNIFSTKKQQHMFGPQFVTHNYSFKITYSVTLNALNIHIPYFKDIIPNFLIQNWVLILSKTGF